MSGREKSTKPKPEDRRVVDKAIPASISVVAIYFLTVYNFVPLPIPTLPTVMDRFVFTLRLQAFPCLCFIWGLIKTMDTRKNSIAIDPINGRGEHLLSVVLRYNTNTLEQFVISFIGQMILATYLPEHQMKAMPILVSIFVVARIVFYVGYSISPTQRAYGFAATFAPTMAVWLLVMYYTVSNMFSAITL